jgi:hypothetical protein
MLNWRKNPEIMTPLGPKGFSNLLINFAKSFDLLKNATFDLLKFYLLIISEIIKYFKIYICNKTILLLILGKGKIATGKFRLMNWYYYVMYYEHIE